MCWNTASGRMRGVLVGGCCVGIDLWRAVGGVGGVLISLINADTGAV